MFLDSQNQFSDEQDLDDISTAEASTNILDLGAVRDIGVGERLYIVGVVDEAITDDDVDVVLRQSANDDMSSHDDLATIFTFADDAPAGTKKVYSIPPDLITKQYIDLEYQASSLTTGKVTTFITNNPDLFTAYQDNSTIS